MAITQLQPFNLNSSNTYTFGNVSSTGNVIVAGVVTATGNVTGANVITAGVVSATGNISGGNISVSGNIAASNFVAPVIITTITYPGDDTAADTAGGQTITITGSGFVAGASVIINGSAVGVVSVVSSTTITFVSPAQSSGSYPLYIVNTNGTTGVAIPGIQYSGTPTWTTAAGSLGSYTETVAIANTVTATGDAPITYSLYSGTLPTGATLNTSNGYISGTSPLEASPTTFTFTIRATDAQKQDTDRQFSLTINPDVVTWSSPANGTTYTNAANSAISNVTMSASAASGQTITYTANALPTGLSISGANITGTPTVVANSSSLLTATAATTNKTATRTINWVITVANDPYFPYVSLLLSANTPSSTFVADASTNNFAITVNGDTKPNNLNPYTPGYYSNYFDGTGDYLTLPSSSAFTLGTSDFTIEGWVYMTAVQTTADGIFQQGTSSFPLSTTNSVALGTVSSGQVWQIYAKNTQNNSTATWTLNTWYHFAVVRNSGTTVLYINGVAVITVTSDTTNYTGTYFGIGSIYGTGYGHIGYISNVRVVNGTAVYTSAFTPPTSPLTAIANTSLLTCQSNRFIDNSTNNFTITRNGDTTISGFIPFTPNSSYSTYGSGYFDGTGDYLATPSSSVFDISGASTFTVECWVYFNAMPAGLLGLVASFNGGTGGSFFLGVSSTVMNVRTGNDASVVSGSTTLTVGRWYHLALVRDGTSSMKGYLNGALEVSSGSFNWTASTQACYIGTYSGGTYQLNGYMSDVRYVLGTAVYTGAFTPPTSPLTAIANTKLLTLQNNQPITNNTFIDNSTNNFLVTRTGNSTQGTFSPYAGSYSNYFDGTGDYLTSSVVPVAATGTFTIECWIYVTSSATQIIYAQYLSSDSTRWYFAIDNNSGYKLVFNQATAGSVWGATVVPLNQWNHIAVTRDSSNIIRIFLNGALDATSATYSASLYTGASQISGFNNNPAYYITGYISNLRILSGTALYTSAFTPPTTPLTPITNTKLLTCQSNRLIDNSVSNSTLTRNGDVSIQKFSPFDLQTPTVPTSYSGYLDGTGDYLSVPYNANLVPGSGDFTIEMWFYTTNGSTRQDPYSMYTATTGIGIALSITNARDIQVYNGNTGLLTTSGSVWTANVWNHLAVTRSGTALRIFVNGTQVGTVTDSTNFTGSTTLYIGAAGNVTFLYTGYISNVRFVKGTAVYTSAFTPPTSPLTAIANTQLLMLQSTTFIDNSTNAYTITATGDSKPTIQNPFGYTNPAAAAYTTSSLGGSMYFDGSGDYITMTTNTPLLSGDFTVELWYYLSGALGSDVYLFDGPSTGNKFCFELISGNIKFIYNGSVVLSATFTPTQGQWYHIALSRSGTSLVFYINGISIGSTTSSSTYAVPATFNIGAAPTFSLYVTGYISNFRIVGGTAVYFSNFVPPYLSPLLAIKNTALLANGTSAGIYDSSMINDMETVGDTKISTSTVKFTGKTSMYFDGTGDYLSIPNNGAGDFGTGDFTVEFWMNASASGTYVNAIGTQSVAGNTTAGIWRCSNRYNGSNGIYFNYTTGSAFVDITFTTTNYNDNSWHHVAWSRSNGTLRAFVDGTQVGTNQTVTQSLTSGQKIYAGYNVQDSAYYTGYVSDLRITKGYARYTSNFTAPTTPFLQY